MSELVTLDYNQKKQARTAHNIFNLNIILVHLFGVVILFELHLIHWFWVIPFLSISIMLFQYHHWKKLFSNHEAHWYVVSNWGLAVKHNRIVFIAYLVCGSIFLAGYTVTNSLASDPNMGKIGMMVFLYLSGNLMLISLVVTFVLSSGAVWHTNKGEVTRALEKIRVRLNTPTNS